MPAALILAGAVLSCGTGITENAAAAKAAGLAVARIAILEARFGSLAGAPFVGDSARDLLAARAAGCRPILLRTGNGRRTEQEVDLSGTVVYDDLAACVTGLLAGESGE